MNAHPEPDDWARACGNLTRKGGEWSGPCPVCGGKDRFHVKRASRRAGAVVDCRQCHAPYAELLKAVGLNGDRGGLQFAQPKPNNDGRKYSRHRVELANTIWHHLSVPIEYTPGAVYLRDTRRVWPQGMAFPNSVRWLSRDNAPVELTRGKQPLAAESGIAPAGCVVFRFNCMPNAHELVKPGEIASVSLEGIDAAGKQFKRESGRARQACGVRSGSVCAVGAKGAKHIVIVEGEVTALAAVWQTEQDAQVLSAGSYSNFHTLTRMFPAERGKLRIEIWADNDRNSDNAAGALAYKLARRGHHASAIKRGIDSIAGSDAADLLQRYIDANQIPEFNSPTE